jgi:hypothetical protein
MTKEKPAFVWEKSRAGLAAAALVQAALAYGAASWAINSGSLWLYVAVFLLFVGFVKTCLKGVKYK